MVKFIQIVAISLLHLSNAIAIDIPQPIAGNPSAAYPPEALKNRQEGRVVISAKVDVNGIVEAASIKESSGHILLDQEALETALKWKFDPIRDWNGDGVSSFVNIPFNFTISKSLNFHNENVMRLRCLSTIQSCTDHSLEYFVRNGGYANYIAYNSEYCELRFFNKDSSNKINAICEWRGDQFTVEIRNAVEHCFRKYKLETYVMNGPKVKFYPISIHGKCNATAKSAFLDTIKFKMTTDYWVLDKTISINN